MQTRLNHFGIIKYHQSPLGQILRQMEENVFTNLSLVVNEQLRVVALLFGELSDTLVGQLIIVVTNMYVFRIHDAKLL